MISTLALEVQPVAVAFALTGGSRDDGHTVGQPLGHAARVRDEVEDVLDGDADGAGIREGDGAHVGIIWRQGAAEMQRAARWSVCPTVFCRPLPPFASLPPFAFLPPCPSASGG